MESYATGVTLANSWILGTRCHETLMEPIKSTCDELLVQSVNSKVFRVERGN